MSIRFFFPPIVLLIVTLLPIRAGAVEKSYVDSLVVRARQEHLSEQTPWLRLGHWRQTIWWDGWKSEADGPGFFLSPRGRTDPARELEATLRGLLSAPTPDGEHPICKFPARFLWLQATLGIDLAQVPMPTCKRFEEYLTALDPGSATLIFSSYFLNNPSSAFGHTFLRINKRGQAGSSRRELLDTGIDYSADVDTSNALLYAIKGMTGQYAGTFKRIPNYFKVREYNDYESRDLWEYDLALSHAQLTMLVAHLWELGSTYFEYYYFDENCSYHILAVLEVADPSLTLLAHVPTPVVPADTIKALFFNPTLVGAIRFRPSLRSQFRQRVRGMSDAQLDAVQALVDDPESPLPRDGQIPVLDAAVDLSDIRYAKELVHEVDSKGARIKQRLMERRAAILMPSQELVLERTPYSKMPQHGHGSRRMGFGGGVQSKSAGGAQSASGFASFDFRWSLHDLADPPAGYPDLSQIEFFPTRIRVWPASSTEQGRFQVADFAFAQVVSLTSWDRFDRKLSFRVRFGGTRIHDHGCSSCFAWRVLTGSGVAKSLYDDRLTLYAMADVDVLASPSLAGIGGSPVRAGIGPLGGVRIRWQDRLVTHAFAQYLWLPGQDPGGIFSLEGVLRWEVARPFALNFEARGGSGFLEAQGSWLIYF